MPPRAAVTVDAHERRMILAVLSDYGITDGIGVHLTPMSGGYLNRSIRVDYHGEAYALRRYQFTQDRRSVEYEHRLLEALPLVLHNAALAKPLRAASGRSLTESADHLFALFPHLRGGEFDRTDINLIREAGRTLAAYHNSSVALFSEPTRRYGFGAVTSLDWVARNVGSVAQVINRNANCVANNLREGRIQSRLHVLASEDAVLRRALGKAPYVSLPHLVIHNDFGPQNLLAEDGQVVGLLDFDLACWESRAYDLATALMWFGEDDGLQAPYETLDGDRKWVPNEERGRAFFDKYVELLERPLTTSEIEYLPLLMRTFLLWVGVWYLDRRLAAMEWYPEEVSGLLAMMEWFRRNAAGFAESITARRH